jgi:hypothetical protein
MRDVKNFRMLKSHTAKFKDDRFCDRLKDNATKFTVVYEPPSLQHRSENNSLVWCMDMQS